MRSKRAHRELLAFEVLVALSGSLLLGATNEPFRYSRSVETKPGFAALELPVEVLAAAAPDLRDVRLVAGEQEVGYALEHRIAPMDARVPLVNVERQPGQDTRALVDRGASPGLADAMSLEIAGTLPFIKPVVVEASEQRDGFREIARGSIYRSGNASSLRLRFPPSDRRYLRLRFDDRLSEPITPEAVVVEQVARAPHSSLVIAAACEPRIAEADTTSLCAAALPSTNLPATNIDFEVGDRVFLRRVRVFELVLFRNQLSRRLLVEGTIERTVDGRTSLGLPVSDLRSNRIEVEVERAGGTLDLAAIRLTLSPRRLIFVAPSGSGRLELLYGSHTATRPHYDLEAVLRKGMPASLEPATLGPAIDRGERSALPSLPRGLSLDPKAYRNRRSIQLPAEGPLAFLDVPGIPEGRAQGLRIVDAQQHQVPFVAESSLIRERVALVLSDQRRERVTTARLQGLDRDECLTVLELDASEPALFQRQVRVVEPILDQRGARGQRLLGQATWERRLDDRRAHLRLALAPAVSNDLSIEIDNADNPPIVLSAAAGEVARTRIDFLFAPGDSLRLLFDPDAASPEYDLVLLSDRLFASPAQRATLGPRETMTSAREQARPAWFWIAFVGAAGLLLAVLSRLVRGGVRSEQ